MATQVTIRPQAPVAVSKKPRFRARSAALQSALLGLCVAGAISCRSKPKPSSDQPGSTAVPIPSESAKQRATGPVIPTLTPELFQPGNQRPQAVYAIEGALTVVLENRVGRVVGDTVEWIGSVPKIISEAVGENIISSVEGRWPDAVGATTYASNGRAPFPTFFPLTWKSHGYMVGPGGQAAWITAILRIEDSFLLVAWSIEQGYHVINVHGPKIKRKFRPEVLAGCERDKAFVLPGQFSPAVRPDAIGTTPAGTMISVGYLCEKRDAPTAEIWGKEEVSRNVDLKPYWSKGDSARKMYKGDGDELFVFKAHWSPVLRYREGKFELLPDLGRPIWKAFTSPAGRFHAFDGRTIFRFEEGRWAPVARVAVSPADAGLPSPSAYQAFAVEGDTFWVTADKGVYRLRPSPVSDAGPEPAADPSAPDACTTPFVYLYEASYNTPTNYTYPKTRKALASFPEVEALALLEFRDDGPKRVGVKVASMAQGEALVVHLRKTLADEDPKLTCYSPWAFRAVPIEGGK